MKKLLFLLLFISGFAYAQPPINNPSPYVVCDDTANNDGIYCFNLHTKDAEISTDATVVITYYETMTDAQTGASINEISSASNPQYCNSNNHVAPVVVYARAVYASNPTNASITTLSLVVNPLPTVPASGYPAITLCETPAYGIGAEQFNLPTTSALLGNVTNMQVDYYDSIAHAQAGGATGLIASPYVNTVAFVQTLGVRVTNVVTGCYATSTMDLKVLPLPVLVTLLPYELCDDATADGHTQFDLCGHIYPLIDPSGAYVITYYQTLIDAQVGNSVNQLPCLYTNTVPYAESIYVRAVDPVTGCFTTMPITLKVNPLPIPNPSTTNYVMYQSVYTGTATFDLTTKDTEIVNGQTGVAVTYFDTFVHAILNGGSGILPTTYTNTTNPQTVYANLYNTTTGCFAITSFNLVVQDASYMAQNDINNTYMNTPVSGSVATNDTAGSGLTLTYTVIPAGIPVNGTGTSGLAGTIHLDATGHYIFTPTATFTGTVVVPYHVCDNGFPVACTDATLTIVVLPIPTPTTTNNSLTANADTATTFVNQPVGINAIANDFDQYGNNFTITSFTQPTGGGLSYYSTGSGGTFDYAPYSGFTGTDTFTYTICNNATPVSCSTATVTITVLANNGNTTFANDDAYNGNMDTPISGNVLNNDTDPEGNTKTVTLHSVAPHGTVTLSPNGAFTYLAGTGYYGNDQFTYTICDNGTPQACDTATVYLTINPVNTILGTNDINNTYMNTPVSGSVATNDSAVEAGQMLAYTAIPVGTAVTGTNGNVAGTFQLDATGHYVFSPNATFTGTIVVPYSVCDNGYPQACTTAVLTIVVLPTPTPANDSVTANADTATTFVNQPVGINAIANDFDEDGNTFTITPGLITTPAHGTAIASSGPTFIYTPDAGYTGPDTFSYQICDNGTPQACSTATVTVTVLPASPVNITIANDDAYNVNMNTTIVGNVLTNDTDPNGDLQTVTSYTQASHGVVITHPDGTFTYYPTTGYYGNDQFTYTICDNGTPQACDTATVYLTVNSLGVLGTVQITDDGVYVDTNADNLVSVGDEIHYTYVLTNTGTSNLTNVNVTDSNATVSGSSITLAAGASDSTTFTGVHVLTLAEINSAQVVSQSTATAVSAGSNVYNTSTDPTICSTCTISNCPTCTYTPINPISGNSLNTVTGTITKDLDLNGCTATDPPASNILVMMTVNGQNIYTYTNSLGYYTFYVDANSYTVTPNVINPAFYSISPTSATGSFATNSGSNQVHDFCVVPATIHNDVEIGIFQIIPARPGFSATYEVWYRNNGNTTVSQANGITFTYDDSKMDLVSTSYAPSTTTTGQLQFSYSNLQPLEWRYFYVTMAINAPTATVPVNIGDILPFTATIEPLSGDETPANNSMTMNQTVVGSYDPNIITCMEGNVLPPSEIGNYLHYVVDFENTGTADTDFVTVRLTINPAQYDVSSLQFIQASNDVYPRIENNIADFFFKHIHLHSGGHGNILLKIKSLSSLVQGDDVNKHADIYFDYNTPVATNVATTIYDFTAGIDQHNLDNSVTVYPNPTSSKINIKGNDAIQKIELFDIQGRLLHTKLTNETNVTFDISENPTGIYFLKIKTEKGIKVEKVVKE